MKTNGVNQLNHRKACGTEFFFYFRIRVELISLTKLSRNSEKSFCVENNYRKFDKF